MYWIVKRTDTFLHFLKPHRHNKPLLDALDKKIKHLQEDPIAIGGCLAGALHGKRSTRLIRKFRLIFSINEEEKTIYLEAIDHRGDIY